ncbi:DUF4148 domain-containing protein [Paraburkholderia sp. GAS334]|jgi:hypothetical protein|uniref:DUF4148 domain-containing protein n=1 Tax=unclassified Paraburkholderia TaxID=2615204 RepID=UPI003D21B33A
MKGLFQAAAIAAVLAAPLSSHAQSQSSVSRAQVRQELIEIENAGYNPSTSDSTAYPENVQAAERRLDARNGQDSAYGGVAAGSGRSGSGRTFYEGDDTQ